MEITCSHIPYQQTGFFSKIVIDYLEGQEQLKPFYKHPVSMDGIKAAIEARKNFATNRELLVTELQKQYEGLPLSEKQQASLASLLSNDTFTITTAHQPNIFTGPLYFIYKIVHAIKLADELRKQLPQYNFVPVYYMGSEDADLDELGFINLNGEKLVWQTAQTGAVGRMVVDKNLVSLIENIGGQINVNQYGVQLTDLFKRCYALGKTIQQATLELVNSLFGELGLLVLIPDNAALKRSFESIIEQEISNQFSYKAVKQTINELGQHYKVQAGGRELNLFYLIDNKRERIEIKGVNYVIVDLNIEWTQEEILAELRQFPERFSANVILRGVFQETVLPNIAFIGGGGELAYWLELKKVFETANVPYPMLLLRNSFLLIDSKYKQLIDKLNLSITDIFKQELDLINDLVKEHSTNQLLLKPEKEELAIFYNKLKQLAQAVDTSLVEHTEALQVKALKRIEGLEKKLLRAEKRKFDEQSRQVHTLKQSLFPNNSLQERVDNFSTYYSKEGDNWIKNLYEASEALKGSFIVLSQQE